MLKNLSRAIDFRPRGKDGKYFSNKKKGEIFEFKEQLHDPKTTKKREALKKVIAAMTVGKDVSSLFTDVMICMETQNVELKKLVYLYLINYAKTKPELVIMVINSFRKDASDANPLIRALAIRTMGCIRVEKMVQYIVDPLKKCLNDPEPYVRKTAVTCVAKFFDLSPESCTENGFIEILFKKMDDSNPTVVANTIAALIEIASRISTDIFVLHSSTKDMSFRVTGKVINKLLAALNECSEWCQISILDFLVTYKNILRKHINQGNQISDSVRRMCTNIIDKILPRLQHSNPAVVLGTIKVMLNFFEFVDLNETDIESRYLVKLRPSLVTILSISDKPELQYVILKSVQLIVQEYPHILEKDIKSFFCRHRDPSYIKQIKLDILVNLVTVNNYDQILSELKEYSTDFVDIDSILTKESIRAIGKIAVTLGNDGDKNSNKMITCCIDIVEELIKTGNQFIVQECTIIVKDICRRYRGFHENLIVELCENLEDFSNRDAKAGFIFILGEFADIIENSYELLMSFLDGDDDPINDTLLYESQMIQLQILTASVKILLKTCNNLLAETSLSTTPHSFINLKSNASKSEEQVHVLVLYVINCCKERVENPDIRDRAEFYYNLLFVTGDFQAAKEIVLGNRKKYDTFNDDAKLEPHFLKSLLRTIGELASVLRKPPGKQQKNKYVVSDSNTIEHEDRESNLLEGIEQEGLSSADNDIFEFDLDNKEDHKESSKLIEYIAAESNSGFGINASIHSSSPSSFLVFEFENLSHSEFSEIVVQFNKNRYGLQPENKTITFSPPIGLNSRRTVNVSLAFSRALQLDLREQIIEIAVKNVDLNQIDKFKLEIDSSNAFTKFALDKKEFIKKWKEFAAEISLDFEADSFDEFMESLENLNFSLVAKTSRDGLESLYFASYLINHREVLMEITYDKAIGLNIELVCTIKCEETIDAETAKMFLANLH